MNPTEKQNPAGGPGFASAFAGSGMQPKHSTLADVRIPAGGAQ